MIRIGLDAESKRRVVREEVERNHIRKVVVFSPPRFRIDYDCNADVEYYTWDDIIMYRVFYPLLEKIDDTYLIVSDELLRKRNRNELTYNCMHHYQNQTPHHIEFEYFPFIVDSNDFMVLADFEKPGHFEGKDFSGEILSNLDVQCVRHHLSLSQIVIDTPACAETEYQREKEKLFANLGSKDPDTIPRALHLWCGKYKGQFIASAKMQYVARNSRFRAANVTTYKQICTAGNRTIIDFPHERIDFNDFLKASGVERVSYLTTNLPVDKYYANEFLAWVDRLEAFYAQTSICE